MKTDPGNPQPKVLYSKALQGSMSQSNSGPGSGGVGPSMPPTMSGNGPNSYHKGQSSGNFHGGSGPRNLNLNSGGNNMRGNIGKSGPPPPTYSNRHNQVH